MKNRREVLRGAVSVASVAALTGGALILPAMASASDADLLGRERDLNAAIERWRLASHAYGAAEERMFAAAPAWPEAILMPADIKAEFDRITVGELALLQQVAPDHPYAAWNRENTKQQTSKIRAYHAKRRRLSKKFGVDAAHAAQSVLFEEADCIAHRILETPAVTVAGLLVKARIGDEWFDYDEGQAEVLAALVTDLKALAEA